MSLEAQRYWTDKELLLLVAAVQKYGFRDFKSIAVMIPTKTEYLVKVYLKSLSRRLNAPKLVNGRKVRRLFLKDVKEVKHIKKWPNVRKWMLMAWNQMLEIVRHNDYSRFLLQRLCEHFYNEAEPATDPQMIDVRAMYRYVLDCVCMCGPAELQPKESTLLLMLLRRIREMTLNMDFKEEIEFIKGYKKSTSFVPFVVKEEFKKNGKTGEEANMVADAVPVVEDQFVNLSRHRRVFQSFNPLTVPMWLLSKEQGFLHKMYPCP